MPGAGVTAGIRMKPVMPPRDIQSTPNLAAFLKLDRRKMSLNAVALDLASDLGDNRHRPDAHLVGGMPASFATEMAMATRVRQSPRRWRGEDDDEDEEDEEEGKRDAGMVSRIMLARMQTLEEGFREVLREVKGLTREARSVVSAEEGRVKRERRERRRREGKARSPLGGEVGVDDIEDGEGMVKRSSV